MHPRFVLHSADWGQHSGNEHSSAYRKLPVLISEWIPPSDASMMYASMMCVEVSDVTMPLAPEVRLQHEAPAETMIIKADVACSHEASAGIRHISEHSDDVPNKQLSMRNPSSARMTAAVSSSSIVTSRSSKCIPFPWSTCRGFGPPHG